MALFRRMHYPKGPCFSSELLQKDNLQWKSLRFSVLWYNPLKLAMKFSRPFNTTVLDRYLPTGSTLGKSS